MHNGAQVENTSASLLHKYGKPNNIAYEPSTGPCSASSFEMGS